MSKVMSVVITTVKRKRFNLLCSMSPRRMKLEVVFLFSIVSTIVSCGKTDK